LVITNLATALLRGAPMVFWLL